MNKVDSFVKNHIIKMLTIKKLMNTMAVCREAAGYPLKMKSKEDLSGTQYRVHAPYRLMAPVVQMPVSTQDARSPISA